MRVLVTGARGFIGRNLVVRLGEDSTVEILPFARGDSADSLQRLVSQADAIVHLAGENRPRDAADFELVNAGLTREVCNAIRAAGRRIPIVLSSSTQAGLDNPYGKSKRGAEQAVEELTSETGNPAVIYRLPGVFGKWCRPNYNSVVATFCHNIANGLPIQINDPDKVLRLVYIDDVVGEIMRVLSRMDDGLTWGKVTPEYSIGLGELATQLAAFRNVRSNLVSEPVGTGLVRALYSTYVSYLPPAEFSYALPLHGDDRGVFVEMLKTRDSGQFSFFTAHPGVTRGRHYHHTKTEKFLVVRGKARFGFRNLVTNECAEIFVSGDKPTVVDTIPGWVHDITNVGDDEMVVMLWANEIFDRDKPDTVAGAV